MLKVMKERAKLYKKAMLLHQEGFGDKRVAKILKIPLGTINSWFYQRMKPLASKFKCNLDPYVLGYVIGVIVGDGSLYKVNTDYDIEMAVTKECFADKFQSMVKELTRNKPHKRVFMPTKGFCQVKKYRIRVRDKILFYLLKELRDKIREGKLPRQTPTFLRGLIIGFYESDGFISRNTKHPHLLFVGLCEKRFKVLMVMKEALQKCGIKTSSIHCDAGTGVHNVRIYTQSEVHKFMALAHNSWKQPKEAIKV